ncbi:coenzyme F390 synthetase [Paenibacillus swuensis]|uniref:Coenzyme F390 synthetase n=2 Tax=Paenibacillus swuensis TaxID=1178515 RepID=A0A172THR2_9BACL|nr:coenzyme F390 synthetase [Paenibacillus swuensis]
MGLLPAQLKRLIEQLAPYLPWYGPWLSAQEESQADEPTWASPPLVTASVLEEHYYIGQNPLNERNDVHCYRTSGTSSGLRKSIYYSEADEEAYIRIKLEVFRSILGPYGYKSALADMGTGHAEATAVEVLRGLGMDVDSISFRLPIEQHLERLESFKPEVLYTMPSILNRIVLAAADPSSYGIKHVVLVGEIASPAWIEQVAERLGLPASRITDTYGSIEIGTIAYYSHEHGRYLLTEGLIAEGLRAEDISRDLEPLSDEAEERVLVLTSAVREAFPAVRYVTYDVVRDLRPILVDGCWTMSFHSLVKRIGPDLKHGEKISIYDIENVVYRHIEQASVRVKVSGNAIQVCVYAPGLSDGDMSLIQDDLEQCIPEIGIMIESGIIDRIKVVRGTLEDSDDSQSIKNKKIFYE